MELLYGKTIPQDTLHTLANQIKTRSGKIVSRTLAHNETVCVTLFSLDSNQNIPIHPSNGGALVTVLEHSGTFAVGDELRVVNTGETLVIPAKLPHSVYADGAFKMLLTEIF